MKKLLLLLSVLTLTSCVTTTYNDFKVVKKVVKVNNDSINHYNYFIVLKNNEVIKSKRNYKVGDTLVFSKK